MKHSKFKNWCAKYKKYSYNTLIMGILNVNPDSFSDGGKYFNVHQATTHAFNMIKHGADIIDIGGESSRPGSCSIHYKEELRRIIPVIENIRSRSDICISVDTTKPVVMKHSILSGASFINDITALSNKNARKIIADMDVPICLMHMQGRPKTMQISPYYKKDIIIEINNFFKKRIRDCISFGINRRRIIIDPGFGFGKLHYHNLRLINKINTFHVHDLPILLGASRKSTIGKILNVSVNNRTIGGITIAIVASLLGISIIRTHDVYETYQAFSVLQSIKKENISSHNNVK